MLGYAFREAIQPDIRGIVYVLQAKDIVRGEPLTDVVGLTKISQDTPGYTFRLKKNDVLLVARGMKAGAFRSTIFLSDASNVIPSSSVLVLRITAPDVEPEYVSHFLNSNDGQDAISDIVSGSYVGAVPRRELEKIKVSIPPRQKQVLFINLYRNILEQERILERKRELKKNIINEAFKKL